MTEKDKPITVEFAPGCFDNFEGTQEELDEFVKEIQELFSNKTKEEIESLGKPLTEEDFMGLPDDVKEKLSRSIDDIMSEEDYKRKLQ